MPAGQGEGPSHPQDKRRGSHPAFVIPSQPAYLSASVITVV